MIGELKYRVLPYAEFLLDMRNELSRFNVDFEGRTEEEFKYLHEIEERPSSIARKLKNGNYVWRSGPPR